MMKCGFCGRPSVVNFPVPKNVDVALDGTPEKIIFEDYDKGLPVCAHHYYTLTAREKAEVYEWIERILVTRFSDGRKRISNLVLLPYLLNMKKLNEDEVEEIMLKWFAFCGVQKRSWELRQEMNYILRRGYKPLTQANFRERVSI